MLTPFVVVVFVAVYLGMALGRWPGLRLDRTGMALLGAILLYVSGDVSAARAADAINFPTLFVLFGLMILSAQFAACGFYDWCAARIAATDAAPGTILALVVLAAGLLSALLANDVVTFAMTPMLCVGLRARGLDPRPFLIALAGGANAGSAATVIGNPQNILIGEAGRLEFFRFLAVCGPPALFGLLMVYLVVRVVWRAILAADPGGRPAEAPRVERAGLVKAVLAAAALLGLFATPLPHAAAALAVASVLLISRRLSTKDVLGLVDWHLLVLFAGLFVVTAAMTDTGLPAVALARLQGLGFEIGRLGELSGLGLLASNTIGNVPAVVLLLAVLPDLPEGVLHGLALQTTLAGNLLIVGSLANIIVVERAREQGVTLGFREHARSGVPITLLSMAFAAVWLWAVGAMGW